MVTKRILLNSPDVFSLGLIWDSASPSVDDIMAVVGNIGLSLQLSEVGEPVGLVTVCVVTVGGGSHTGIC